MELYEVKKAGFASPLSSVEIMHLFRVGHLHRRVRCKPTGEKNWRTIGELFPLLDYGALAYSLPSDDSKSGRRLAWTFAVAVALLAGSAFFYGNQPARGSAAIRSAVQSRNQDVAAATAASVFLLYSRSARDTTELRSAGKSHSPQAASGLVLARND